MGFRSALAMQDIGDLVWPEWFRARYADHLAAAGGVLVAPHAIVVYTQPSTDLARDLLRALTEAGWWNDDASRRHVYVWLHEGGTLTSDVTVISGPDD